MENETRLTLKLGEKGRLIVEAKKPINIESAQWKSYSDCVILDESKQTTPLDALVVSGKVGIGIVECQVLDANGESVLQHSFRIEVVDNYSDSDLVGSARVSRESEGFEVPEPDATGEVAGTRPSLAPEVPSAEPGEAAVGLTHGIDTPSDLAPASEPEAASPFEPGPETPVPAAEAPAPVEAAPIDPDDPDVMAGFQADAAGETVIPESPEVGEATAGIDTPVGFVPEAQEAAEAGAVAEDPTEIVGDDAETVDETDAPAGEGAEEGETASDEGEAEEVAEAEAAAEGSEAEVLPTDDTPVSDSPVDAGEAEAESPFGSLDDAEVKPEPTDDETKDPIDN